MHSTIGHLQRLAMPNAACNGKMQLPPHEATSPFHQSITPCAHRQRKDSLTPFRSGIPDSNQLEYALVLSREEAACTLPQNRGDGE